MSHKKPGDKARTVCDGTLEKLAKQQGVVAGRLGTNRYQLPALAGCTYPSVQWFILLALIYWDGWGFGGDVDSAYRGFHARSGRHAVCEQRCASACWEDSI